MNESPPDHRLTPLLSQVHTNDDESCVAPPPEPSLSQQEEDITNDLDPTNSHASTSTTVTSNPSDGQNEEIDATGSRNDLIVEGSGAVDWNRQYWVEFLSDGQNENSWCSFINYGWTFGKWLMVVCAVNIVTAPEPYIKTLPLVPFVLVPHFDFYHFDFYHFDFQLQAIIWFLTSAWFFWSAKVVERDLKRLDRIAQYEEGGQTDEEEANGADQNEANSNNYFDLNYDNIYGRVSRCIDKAWSSNSTTSPQEPSSTLAVSSLVNFAYIFWALYAASSFAAATMVVIMKIYESECKGDLYIDMKCVLDHGGIYVIIIKGVVLLACTLWMIFQEGVPSGIVPFIYIPIEIFCGLTKSDSATLTVILMTFGTISFHIIINCGDDSRTCNLSSLTLEMITWALYSYLTAFLIFDQSIYNDHFNNIPRTFAVLYIVLTAFILEHPLLNVVGIILILFSILGMLWSSLNSDGTRICCSDFRTFHSGIYEDGDMIFITACGFGLIVVLGFLTKIRRNPRVLACFYALNQYFTGRQRQQ